MKKALHFIAFVLFLDTLKEKDIKEIRCKRGN